jgi:crotonobetainyl-CoA:carnitine CoA-transferase CaiB-like acyl-CoA transferase
MHSDATPRLPLAGIRVLEFCHTIMGPSAGLILADLGADVIKIEPADGDPTRRRIGFAAGFFATFNRNKRSFAVDLKSSDGRALLHRLLGSADVVLEKFRARHDGAAWLRIPRPFAKKPAADLLRFERLPQRTLRAPSRAR